MVLARHHLCLTSRPFVEAMGATAAAIAQASAAGGQGGPSNL